MPRLRHVDVSRPGWTRTRDGDSWAFADEQGRPITDAAHRERLLNLVLPPAWTDVWICPHPNGHIQATGFDVKRRRQYRYHDQWRIQRDAAKFDHVLDFAEALLEARPVLAEQLQSSSDLSRDRVLACAVRLLDFGFFRIGGEEYAEENQSYGLATMRKEHLRISGNEVTFAYPAKSGKHQVKEVADEPTVAVLQRLRRRRGGGPELLAYKHGKEWMDVKSDDINDAVRNLLGGDYTAKDFRTWSATVHAAVALSVSGPAAASPTSSKRAISRAVKEVSEWMGNTPAVARASYIDPRVIDLYQGGVTIADVLEDLGAGVPSGLPGVQGEAERAVLAMLRDDDPVVAEPLEQLA